MNIVDRVCDICSNDAEDLPPDVKIRRRSDGGMRCDDCDKLLNEANSADDKDLPRYEGLGMENNQNSLLDEHEDEDEVFEPDFGEFNPRFQLD